MDDVSIINNLHLKRTDALARLMQLYEVKSSQFHFPFSKEAFAVDWIRSGNREFLDDQTLETACQKGVKCPRPI